MLAALIRIAQESSIHISCHCDMAFKAQICCAKIICLGWKAANQQRIYPGFTAGMAYANSLHVLF